MVLPDKFIENLRSSLGETVADTYLQAFSANPVVGVRRNPYKFSEEGFIKHFSQYGVSLNDWCESGLILQTRPDFTFDPLFHSGAYYVQEPSSMAVGLIVGKLFENRRGLCVLDLCAAPGGKSTDIASHLPDASVLVCNEVMKSRASVLAENMAKWGSADCIVTNSDPAAFRALEGYFDVILVDAPCSGEGMFRKDVESLSEWSEDTVALCSSRQKRILADIWDSLREGGHLIYSTCTFNRYENDGNVKWLMEEFGAEPIPVSSIVGRTPDGVVVTSAGSWQFVPGMVKGEGFYVSVVHKPLSNSSKARVARSRKPLSRNILIDRLVTERFGDEFLTKYDIGVKNDMVKAFPKHLASILPELERTVRVIRSGVAMGTLKGKDLIPEADLALSCILPDNAFPVASLTLKESIDFLSREPITIPESPKGFVLVEYSGYPLGFVKNLGNRTNSLHPMSRRILTRQK